VLVRLGVKFGVNTGVSTELNPFFQVIQWRKMVFDDDDDDDNEEKSTHQNGTVCYRDTESCRRH